MGDKSIELEGFLNFALISNLLNGENCEKSK